MNAIQEPFTINYFGVAIKVTPLINGLEMMYMVELPTRSVMIQPVQGQNEVIYWEEVNTGRTEVSESIGEIIESRDL